MWKGRGAFSRERPRPIALRAGAIASLERWTSKCLCCEFCSIKLRPVALRPRQKQRRRGFCRSRSNASGQAGRALYPDVLHKGFGLAAVRSPLFLEGATLERRAGGPNAAQPELL